jgi:hypothetical protein
MNSPPRTGQPARPGPRRVLLNGQMPGSGDAVDPNLMLSALGNPARPEAASQRGLGGIFSARWRLQLSAPGHPGGSAAA